MARWERKSGPAEKRKWDFADWDTKRESVQDAPSQKLFGTEHSYQRSGINKGDEPGQFQKPGNAANSKPGGEVTGGKKPSISCVKGG